MANPAQNKDRAAVQSGLNDLLGNVIRNDRTRAGRGGANTPETSPVPVEATAPITTPSPSTLETMTASAGRTTAKIKNPEDLTSENQSPSIMTDKHSDIMTNGQADGAQAPNPKVPKAEIEIPKGEVAQVQRKMHTANGSRSSGRVKEAEVLAATPTMTVTLRIPQGLNEWLDGYVHGSWPHKIRKQELVVEALKLAYARRGKAGEEIIETELLGGSDGA